MQQTENYDLNLMDLSDPLRMESREGLNENFTIIDEALKDASENGGIAVQDTQPTTGVLAWIDSDAQGADFCMVGDTEPPTDGTVALWVDTSEDERPIDLVDYIIEQGTSGIWTYRKWKSGIAECWGSKNYTFEVTRQYGSVYISTSTAGAEPFPFSFTAIPTISTTQENSNGWLMFDIRATTTNTNTFFSVRPVSANSVTVFITFHAIGRWK